MPQLPFTFLPLSWKSLLLTFQWSESKVQKKSRKNSIFFPWFFLSFETWRSAEDFPDLIPFVDFSRKASWNKRWRLKYFFISHFTAKKQKIFTRIQIKSRNFPHYFSFDVLTAFFWLARKAEKLSASRKRPLLVTFA